jgi:hypothetical protein
MTKAEEIPIITSKKLKKISQLKNLFQKSEVLGTTRRRYEKIYLLQVDAIVYNATTISMQMKSKLGLST